MTTTEQHFTVFTRSRDDHSKVYVISNVSGYAQARRIARSHAASIMFADQFAANFTASSINGMNGTLR